MIKRLKEEYINVSIEMKAATWYAVSNIGQKIAPWLVMFILTHVLSTEEYGVYSVYMSWLEIFEILVTLRIYSSGYVAGLVKKNQNKEIYTATMQSLCFILITAWIFIYFVLRPIINEITRLSTIFMLMIFFSFYASSSFGLWSSRQRVENKYKNVLLATISFGFLGPVLGASTVFLNLNDSIFWVVLVRTAIQLMISIPFVISNYKNVKSKIERTLAKGAISYNLPLLPYYLSMVLLNHSDRLMIQKIDGYTDAAIYSVAYSVSMIVFIISGALNLSLQAWLFKAIKTNTRCDQSKQVTSGTIIVMCFSWLVLILAPEAINIIGGTKYAEAIWVMPPIVISVIVMFIYQQYVNVLFYFNKTKLIMFSSVLSAVFNIVLNAIFIPRFGYYAAGYTTLISYLLVYLLYLLFMKRICAKQSIYYRFFFNVSFQAFVIICSIGMAFISMILYRSNVIRYIFLVGILIILFVLKNKIINIFRIRK